MVILSTSKTVFKSFCLYYTGCAYKTPYAVCSEFLPLSVKIGHKKKRQHSVCYTVCFFALANRLFLRMDFSNILMRSSRFGVSLFFFNVDLNICKSNADERCRRRPDRVEPLFLPAAKMQLISYFSILYDLKTPGSSGLPGRCFGFRQPD